MLEHHGGFVKEGKHLIWAARAIAASGGEADRNRITETAVVPKAISDWYNNASDLVKTKRECNIETEFPSPVDQVKKECNVCGQKLTSDENLKDHVILHTKEKGRLDSIFEPTTGGVIKSENIDPKQIGKNTNLLHQETSV